MALRTSESPLSRSVSTPRTPPVMSSVGNALYVARSSAPTPAIPRPGIARVEGLAFDGQVLVDHVLGGDTNFFTASVHAGIRRIEISAGPRGIETYLGTPARNFICRSLTVS